MGQLNTILKTGKSALGFLAYAYGRYGEDRCRTVAASLSYTSLLALVPFTAIVFAVLSYFPMLEDFRFEMQVFLFNNMMPDSGDAVIEAFDGFVANAGSMTGFGVVGLLLTSIFLLNTIFATMNMIFRVDRPRPILWRIAIYLGVLIIGPLLLAASFSLATYMLALTKGMGLDVLTGFLGRLARFVPALILIFGFTLFYKIVPKRYVLWRDAVIGGLLAGLCFSGLRWLFGIYLIYFPTYQALYGALSAVPVFLVWMFLSWTVILLGAVLVASLPDWRAKNVDETVEGSVDV